MEFTKNVLVFVVGLIITIIIFEWSGLTEAWGVNAWEAFSIIPDWLLYPVILMVMFLILIEVAANRVAAR